MPFVPRLHHVAISVEDLESAVGWYVDKLGFVTDYRYDVPEIGLRAVFLSGAGFRLEIFQLDETVEIPEPERDFSRYLRIQGLRHFALGVDDLEAARAELETRGVEFVTDIAEVPGSGGERYCFFVDPGGILIELFHPVDA